MIRSLLFVIFMLLSCVASTESETKVGKMVCKYGNGVSDESPIIWKNGRTTINFEGLEKGLECTIKF